MALNSEETTSARAQNQHNTQQDDQVHHNHPLYVHPSDTQGSILTSIKLQGSENYSLWSKSMKLVLQGKNKLGFVLGTCKKENYQSNLHDLWDRCNAIVLGWILNTVSKELITSVIYGSDAHKVWEDLRERFNKVNASRVFFLHKEIATLTQGTSSVSTYFSRLRELWDEFEALVPPPNCSCPESKNYAEHFHMQKLWQFLMGLNETYDHSRSQILMIYPLPNVNQAYAMIVNVESQRRSMIGNFGGILSEVGDSTALMSNRNANYHNNHNNYNSGYNNNSGNFGSTFSGYNSGFRPRNNAGKSGLFCDYCKIKGHTKDVCRKLHGYPSDLKFKKKGHQSRSYANNVVNTDYTTSDEQQPYTRYADSHIADSHPYFESSSEEQFVPFFTKEQHSQILQMLNRGKEHMSEPVTKLNKLTPQNFEKLFQQVEEVNIDNVVTLNGVVSQIFDKALMEPTFCEMYANFCQHLAAELPDLSVDKEKITFKRLLLNKCQEEFERGEREEQEANVTNEEGEVKLSAEEREEKRVKARRRRLGNIRLIGELYKKRMLTERIMHECIKKLLGDYQNPDEENVEALCKLMSTIGEMIDHAKAKEHMDAYFDRMEKLSNNMKLSSRVRFMLKDSIDLRKNKWQQRRKVEGPKKIEEVHRDAAQERHLQATRLARTPSLGGSNRRGQPMDFAPRGSMLSSPGPQMGGFRPMSPQVRGYGLQDVRVDERHSFENRTLSLPLTQRPLGDDPITLGPQGCLAKGMSSRGQPAGPSTPFTDNMPSFGDSRRMTHAQNGYGSLPECPPYGSREELMPKYMPERLSSQHDRASAPERNLPYGSKDRGFDAARPVSPLVRSGGPTSTQNVAPDKIWSEERLRDMSLAAIKEFYRYFLN